MEQYKCRAKDIETGAWRIGYLFPDKGIWYIRSPEPEKTESGVITIWTHDNYEIDPDTAGGYTGEKDRQGQELYTGDLVQFAAIHVASTWERAASLQEFKRELRNPTKFRIEEIKFKEGIFYFERQYGREGRELSFDQVSRIGNIYDNPEIEKGVTNAGYKVPVS